LPPDRGRDGVGCLSRCFAVKRPSGRGDGKRGCGSARRPDSESSWSVADCWRSPFPARPPHGTVWRATCPLKAWNGQRPSIEELKAKIEAGRSGDTMDPSGLRLTNLAVFELELATRLSPGGCKIPATATPAAAGDRAGLPRLGRPKSRGAPYSFARRRVQSSGALKHASCSSIPHS
jgi:hypothetical protein